MVAQIRYSTLKIAAIVFILVMASGIAVAALTPLVASTLSYGELDATWIAMAMSYGLLTPSAIYVLRHVTEMQSAFGFSLRRDWKWLTAALLFAVLLFTLLRFAQYNLDALAAQHLTEELSRLRNDVGSMQVPSLLAFILAGHFLIPAFEEVVFRGILLSHLTSKYNWLVGSIVSTLAFVTIHHSFYANVAVFGVIAALLKIKTRSLIAPIVMHMAYNTLVSLDAMYR